MAVRHFFPFKHEGVLAVRQPPAIGLGSFCVTQHLLKTVHAEFAIWIFFVN